jgi:hypothetical protein
LKTGEWTPTNGDVHDTLKDAKVAAESMATAMFGRKPTEMKWH